MADARSDVAGWRAAGRIAPGRVRDALRIAQAIPAAAAWQQFLERLLLWTGLVAISASLGFFIAANWSALGRFGKLALVEAVVVVALGLVIWRGIDSGWGRALLIVASLAVGTLLALVGQTYQTGADPWQLFAVWAVAIVAWVIVGRQPALWLLWIGILDVAAFLYITAGFIDDPAPTAALWVLLAIHAVALIAWEAAIARGVRWLDVRWAPRVLAIGAGTAASLLVVEAIFRGRVIDPGVAAYVAFLAALYWAYRIRRVDIVMLAAGVLSVVVLVPIAIGRAMHVTAGIGFLGLALVTIGIAAAGAMWLRSVVRSER